MFIANVEKKKLGWGSQLAQQVSLRRAWRAWWKERTVPTIGFLTDNASSHTIYKCIFLQRRKFDTQIVPVLTVITIMSNCTVYDF